MCTLSFLPDEDGGYLLAHSRDELVTRAVAAPPTIRELAGQRVVHPCDPDGGGTWIAAVAGGRTLCLLNGDRPPSGEALDEPLSRGLLVLVLMPETTPDAMAECLQHRIRTNAMPFQPFKLLLAMPGGAGHTARLHRLAWDGLRLARDEREDPHIEISSAHARGMVHHARRGLFAGLIGDLAPAGPQRRDQLLAFHRSHAPGTGVGDALSICMHREDAHTMSLTLVEAVGGAVRMDYHPGQPCERGAVQTLELENPG